MHDDQTPKPVVTDARPASRTVSQLAGADTGYFSDPAFESPAAAGPHVKRLQGEESSHLVTRRDPNGYGYFE